MTRAQILAHRTGSTTFSCRPKAGAPQQKPKRSKISRLTSNASSEIGHAPHRTSSTRDKFKDFKDWLSELKCCGGSPSVAYRSPRPKHGVSLIPGRTKEHKKKQLLHVLTSKHPLRTKTVPIAD